MTNKTTMMIAMGISLMVGVGGTVLVGSLTDSPDEASASSADAHAGHDHPGDEPDTFYTCPMHPTVISATPGACPVCGMDLIKKTQSAAGMDPQELAAIGRVALSPTQRVLANVQTTEVSAHAGAEQAAGEVRAVGVVSYNEQGLASIPSWVDGRIERLLIKETGAKVRRGQPVMKIYSEELLTAQQEYLVSLASSDKTLAKQTRKRLELLGMRPAQINQVRKTGQAEDTVTAFAPNAGTITEIKVRQGQYVTEGAPLYEIADLSTVWVDAEVSEKNLSALHEGMPVRVQVDALPGESLQGKIGFIHPVVDKTTRRVKVRVELDNAGGKLKPGMYAAVYFQIGAEEIDSAGGSEDGGPAEVMVPKSAVIRGGKTNSVYVEVEENMFERREVEVGRATEKSLAITSGLKPGDTIAYQGGFLLDSEVQLNSFGGAGGGHDHGGGDHGGESLEHAEHAEHEKLTHADIPKDGKKFDPPIPSDAVPDGAWFCDMNHTAHWVQHEKGDGKCPVCGMFLTEKGAQNKDAQESK